MKDPEMDERAVAVDHAAGRQAWLVMSWLLVLDLGLRGRYPDWVTWAGFPVDIMVILLAGGVTRTAVNWQSRTLTRQRVRLKGLAMVLGLVLAGAVAWLSRSG